MRSWGKDKTKKEFEELLLEVKRVTRVTTWWRKLSFRATILVWNRKWKIWLGVSKGADVSIAVSKASHEAYKNMFTLPMTRNQTVPYPTTVKYKACLIKLLPASAGTGLKAGSSVRAVLELAGYENVLSKIIGSNNKLNNAMATIRAICAYKHADYFNALCVKKTVHKDEEISEEPEETSEEAEKKVVTETVQLGDIKTIEVEKMIPEDGEQKISEDKKLVKADKPAHKKIK